MSASVEILRRESASLVQRLRLWTPQRWAAQAPSYGTRADVVFHLAQALADTAADVEGEPRRALPRLGSDLALPDQLAVVSADLAGADPQHEVAVAATAHVLAHRQDVLADEVPAGLVGALGVPDVVALGRNVCSASGGGPA